MTLDPSLSLLREIAGPVPSDVVDFETLARRIAADGAEPLRARRARWWDYTVRWARMAVPVGLAAAAAAGIALALTPQPRSPAATLIETVSGAESSAHTFETAVVGPGSRDWIVAAAIGDDE